MHWNNAVSSSFVTYRFSGTRFIAMFGRGILFRQQLNCNLKYFHHWLIFIVSIHNIPNVNMNTNHKKFHWYLNVHLRSIFKIIFLDMNEKPMKYSIGYFAIMSVLISAVFGCVYTYFNDKELSISPIFAIGMSVAPIQVSSFRLRLEFSEWFDQRLIIFWIAAYLQVHVHQRLIPVVQNCSIYWRDLRNCNSPRNLRQIRGRHREMV